MRDQEKPAENWGLVEKHSTRVDDDKANLLRWYLKNSSTIRKAHGIGNRGTDGKYLILDLEKIKKFDDFTKAVLREFLKE